MNSQIKEAVDHERYKFLARLEAWLEMPVLLLGFAWFILLIFELIWGLNPLMELAVYIIWAIFIMDFLVRLILVPKKSRYLKKNWLTAVSLVVPAFRIFRIVRVIRILRLTRAVRGLQLFKIISTLNRQMRSLRSRLRLRLFGYVVSFTAIVILVGAAGMYAFEGNYPGSSGFASYGDSLWWTAMIITTQGSEAWPKSLEGRILGFILSVYAFTVFGYVTATLASYFIGRDKKIEEIESGSSKDKIEELISEINALREDLSRNNKNK